MIRIKDIVVLEEAVEDLKEGRDFYSKKNPGVGEYFWDSLIADFESLYIYAGIHIKKYGLFRLLSKRFPYAVYYNVDNHIAYIVAVLPMRRDPDIITNKVRKRRKK